MVIGSLQAWAGKDGASCLKATLRYTHVRNRQVAAILCPLDRLPL